MAKFSALEKNEKNQLFSTTIQSFKRYSLKPYFYQVACLRQHAFEVYPSLPDSKPHLSIRLQWPGRCSVASELCIGYGTDAAYSRKFDSGSLFADFLDLNVLVWKKMCNSVPLHNRIKYQGPQLRISDGQTQVRRQSDANQTWMCWKVFVPCLHFFCSKTQTLGLRSCSLINMFSYECLCKDLGGIYQDSRCWLHLLDLHETVVCDVTQDTSFMKQPTYICKSIACWICRRNNRLRWGQIPKGHATWQTEMITSLNSDRIEKKKTKSKTVPF